MTAIEITKLKLRCSAELRERTRFAIEDGLRTSIPDDRRLVLLRKMRVTGRADPLRPALRDLGISHAWLTAISDARHGGDDGAANANCVWFASRDEAERLLISRLIAGRAVDAWFWKLALPHWRGLPLNDWVPAIVSQAISQCEDRRVLAIANCFMAAGATSLLIDLLTRDTPCVRLPAGPRLQNERAELAKSQDQRIAGLAEARAATLQESMPLELRRAIAAVVRAGRGVRLTALAMVRAWLLRQSPALAISPAFLAAITRNLIDAVANPDQRGAPRRERIVGSPSSERQGGPRSLEGSLDRATRDRTQRVTVEQLDGPVLTAGDPEGSIASDEARPSEVEAVPKGRLSSAHAGLWLVIPSLIELGFREWLQDRPALLGESPASQLLHEIARHHRVVQDDPALIALAPLPDPHARPEWTRLWRHGLDRWLRRTVKRRLHDLVNRQGGLDFADQSLVVHYRPIDVDIALRRRCLDRDPGWTDWLGLSVRYIFGGTEDWL